jgi:hypothetical protein
MFINGQVQEALHYLRKRKNKTMANFAELDETNAVKRVIVVHNDELLDENGIESEQKGIDFCVNLLGGTWIQTSYNANFRSKFAGIGDTYNPVADVFILPKCHDEAVLDEATYQWICTNEAHTIKEW